MELTLSPFSIASFMAVPLIQTSNLENTFRSLRERPRSNVLVDPRNIDGNIPAHIAKAMVKRAQAGGIDRVGQFRYNPFLQATNLDIPSDLKIRHQYMRYFVKTNALVGAAVELHCIPSGEPVLVQGGIKPIESVTKGDKVLSSKGHWQTVLNTQSHVFEGKMYSIKVSGLPPFRCTNEHPILVRPSKVVKTARTEKGTGRTVYDSKRKEPSLEPAWKQAEALCVGDYVLLPKYKPAGSTNHCIDLAPYVKGEASGSYRVEGEYLISSRNQRRRYLTLTKDLATLLGWYVAEGSSGTDISLNVKETTEAQDITNLLQRCADITACVPYDRTSRVGHKCKVVHFSYGPFGRWLLDACGNGSHNKKVPQFILDCPDLEIVKAFLKAYYDGDGCDQKYDKLAITVSQTLAYQLQMLAGRLGVVVDVKRRVHTHTGGMQYGLRSLQRDWITKVLGEPVPFKKNCASLTFQDDDYFYAPIREISYQNEKTMVHDIHTEDHSFAVPFIVHNSEFPLSGFHIEHEDPAVQEFLEDMIEETDLVDHVLMAAMEWWTVGEFFSFGFFDNVQAPSCWTGFLLLDPDKLLVQASPWIRGPRKEKISMIVDNVTQKIIDQGPNHPVTGSIFRELPQDIVMAARARRPLELSPLQVAHCKRGSPFALRGESIIERVFPLLMYRDKLRSAQYSIADRHISPTEIWKVGESGDPADQAEIESFRDLIASQYNDTNRCFHPSHECLTKAGWKNYQELTYSDEIGTFNQRTGCLEYQKPEKIHVYDFNGELVHFTKGYNDIMVTPNHRMLVDQKKIVGSFNQTLSSGKKTKQMVREFTNDWKIVQARDIKPMSRFRASVDSWQGAQPIGGVNVTSTVVLPVELYLRFAGWFISEGSAGQAADGGWFVAFTQKETGRHFQDIETMLADLAPWFKFGKSVAGGDGCARWVCWGAKELAQHCSNEFGKYAANKVIPQWIRELGREHLSLFLTRLINGDGHRVLADTGTRLQAVQYACTSRLLVDHIQEIAFKLGKAPRVSLSKVGVGERFASGKRKNGTHSDIWLVYWNEDVQTGKGDFPYVGDYHTWKEDKQTVPYEGKVWCVTVPNETVVTRRNGRISISGNSVIWHHALQYQIEGANGKIMPIWQEMEGIDNEILAGLLLNKSLIMGDSSTFASDVVRYDILVQRYMLFRKRIEKWILRSIMAPVLKIHEMYVPEYKVKSHQFRQMAGKGRPLAMPTIKWEKQNLRDDQARTQLLIEMAAKQLVPYSTIYPLLNLDPRQVNERIDKEIEEGLIRKKKLAERLARQGINLPVTLPGQEGEVSIGGGELPSSFDSSGGGLPSAPGGLGGAMDAGGSLPGGPGGGLPEMVPGTAGGATENLAGGLQGAPSESSLPVGIPTE